MLTIAYELLKLKMTESEMVATRSEKELVGMQTLSKAKVFMVNITCAFGLDFSFSSSLPESCLPHSCKVGIINVVIKKNYLSLLKIFCSTCESAINKR